MRKIVVCEDGEREAEKIQKILQDDQGIFEEEIEIFLYTTGKKLIDDCKLKQNASYHVYINCHQCFQYQVM